MLEQILSLFLIGSSSVGPTPNDAYSVVLNKLSEIVRNHPGTSRLFELGLSDSGRKIIGIQIGDGDRSNLIVGTHHGNEYGSTAVALGAASEFARNPLPGHKVFIVPVLNISGYNSGSRYETTPKGRIDPNRDYPSPCATSGPFHSRATRALADFVGSENIISSATLHTYFPGVLYPWGISTNDVSTPDDAQFIRLSKLATENSRYQYGNSKDLLYAADGTFEDYIYWKHGVWSLLFELGHSHNPNQGDLKEMIEANVPGLRKFLEQAPAQRSANHNFSGRCDLNVMKRTHLE